MANALANRLPHEIPRYVQRLNAVGESRGVTVETVVAPYDNDPTLRLWSRWRTTRERLLSLGLFTRGQHLPSTSGNLSVPGWQYLNHHRALMTGQLTSVGDEVVWEIDWGPSEFSIVEAGEVQIVTWESEVLYHGTAEALVAHGIDRKRLPLAKRPSKSWVPYDDCNKQHWWSRRQLDGAIVHRVESESTRKRRMADRERLEQEIRREHAGYRLRQPLPQHVEPVRPAYLRLVVDNTRDGA